MLTSLRLVDITRDNFDAVACLSVHDHQRDFLASNSYSIAEASFNPALRTRAVYVEDRPVGFIMYVVPESDDDEPGCYGIWRFMIDQACQGLGYGRAALSTALREIESNGDASKIFISYKQDNELAKRFYESFGFEEDGVDADSNEMVAVLDPTRGRSR
jgi:diamine N-acetyltransferase